MTTFFSEYNFFKINLIDPASPLMYGIIELHDHIFFFLNMVLFLVLFLLGTTLKKFSYKKGSRLNRYLLSQSTKSQFEWLKLNHGTNIEIIWTIVPSLILVMIAIPSFALLYATDELVDPSVTIQVIGHQWYWSYEYNDLVSIEDKNLSKKFNSLFFEPVAKFFDSPITDSPVTDSIPDDDLETLLNSLNRRRFAFLPNTTITSPIDTDSQALNNAIAQALNPVSECKTSDWPAVPLLYKVLYKADSQALNNPVSEFKTSDWPAAVPLLYKADSQALNNPVNEFKTSDWFAALLLYKADSQQFLNSILAEHKTSVLPALLSDNDIEWNSELKEESLLEEKALREFLLTKCTISLVDSSYDNNEHKYESGLRGRGSFLSRMSAGRKPLHFSPNKQDSSLGKAACLPSHPTFTSNSVWSSKPSSVFFGNGHIDTLGSRFKDGVVTVEDLTHTSLRNRYETPLPSRSGIVAWLWDKFYGPSTGGWFWDKLPTTSITSPKPIPSPKLQLPSNCLLDETTLWDMVFGDDTRLTGKQFFTGTVEFDSYMRPESDLSLGELRLYETDFPLVLPKFTHIRFMITADDVIHSWSVPSLGIKVDAVPGRINHAHTYIKYSGIFYGQCSELCGVNHAFMPIQILVFEPQLYYDYIRLLVLSK